MLVAISSSHRCASTFRAKCFECSRPVSYGDDVTEHWLGAVTILLARYLDNCDAVSGRSMVALSREFRAFLALLEEERRQRGSRHA